MQEDPSNVAAAKPSGDGTRAETEANIEDIVAQTLELLNGSPETKSTPFVTPQRTSTSVVESPSTEDVKAMHSPGESPSSHAPQGDLQDFSNSYSNISEMQSVRLETVGAVGKAATEISRGANEEVGEEMEDAGEEAGSPASRESLPLSSLETNSLYPCLATRAHAAQAWPTATSARRPAELKRTPAPLCASGSRRPKRCVQAFLIARQFQCCPS